MLNILRRIFNHPFNSDNKFGGLMRFVKWQINTYINPYPIVYPYTENTKLIVWKGLTGATGNIYCGLMEFNDMAFLLHFLRKNDDFIDIGANIGVYSILASGEIGANTIAIEPVPTTFNYLMNNISINNIRDKVRGLNIGLGNKKGILKFTKSLDTLNHIAVENEIDTIDVEIETLDSIISKTPILIKIDVEGFEAEVLNGAEKTLRDNHLKGVIIELNGLGKRYGYDEKLIHIKLLELGFKPYTYNPINRQLIEIPTYGSHNTIYLRDLQFVNERISSSRKIKIMHREI